MQSASLQLKRLIKGVGQGGRSPSPKLGLGWVHQCWCWWCLDTSSSTSRWRDLFRLWSWLRLLLWRQLFNPLAFTMTTVSCCCFIKIYVWWFLELWAHSRTKSLVKNMFPSHKRPHPAKWEFHWSFNLKHASVTFLSTFWLSFSFQCIWDGISVIISNVEIWLLKHLLCLV